MVQTSGYAATAISIQPLTANITTALRAFLCTVLPPGLPVQLAQQNRTVAPAGPFALLTLLGRQPLATPAQRETATSSIVSVPEEMRVQVSFFGSGAGDNAQRIATLFRTEWACRFFETLFCQNGSEDSSNARTSLGTVADWLENHPAIPTESETSQPSTTHPKASPSGMMLAAERVNSLSAVQAAQGDPPLATCEKTQRPNVFSLNTTSQPAPPPYAPARLVPLYAGLPRQMPFVNGERQFEEHWLLDLHCQVHTTLTLPTTTASAASLALVCADTVTDDPPA